MIEPRLNKISGLMSGFFTPQEIRQYTNAQPNLISEAEFFMLGHSDDKVLKQALHYFDPKLPRNFAPQAVAKRLGVIALSSGAKVRQGRN
ncbi:hypothetical protein [Photobacterium phosphoreum]|uniref:hypothetical protein n=1 Tax=Photobacterium phosphoreum TaxID=659 RepID=UPI0007F8FB34|nr:hypothetical protein [Photobacterium phosphoreum]OBU37429.1 hypothetical protein AYY24_11435 [Photobacterium phosphoreum]